MNNIPIVLDMETNRYGAWADLFRVHARFHWILHHIVPSENKPPPPLTNLTYDYWTALDAIVLQWTYSIIYVDLLTTVMEPCSTNLDAWKRLADLFQENQNICVVTIKQEFSEVHMENFSNVSAYF